MVQDRIERLPILLDAISKSRPAFPSLGGSGAYAIRALPDLCLGIVLGCLEPHQVSLGFSGFYALYAPARPGLSFTGCVSAELCGHFTRADQAQLTQGDENNDADDRHKEYGREGSG
jgi:hypothetical protein